MSPKDHREKHLKSTFGISVEEYETMLAYQNEVCAICENKCKTGRRLAVDHDHETGEIRGLLCASCNTGLGSLGDSVIELKKAIDYLS